MSHVPNSAPPDVSRLLRSLEPVRQQVRLERLLDRLAEGPVLVAAARRLLLRSGVLLDLADGPSLTLWLYRPLRIVPGALRSLRWHDEAGWIAGVTTVDLQPAVLLGYQIRIGP